MENNENGNENENENKESINEKEGLIAKSHIEKERISTSIKFIYNDRQRKKK